MLLLPGEFEVDVAAMIATASERQRLFLLLIVYLVR